MNRKLTDISSAEIDAALEFAHKPATTFSLAKIPLSKISIKKEMHFRAELKENVVDAYARELVGQERAAEAASNAVA